jgi:ATP-dependent RNA helicase DDX46/PRP5
VTHKGALDQLIEETQCAITTKGDFFQQGRNPPPNARKLYLLIEGASEMMVARCKGEIMRMVNEAIAENRPEPQKYAGRYTV